MQRHDRIVFLFIAIAVVVIGLVLWIFMSSAKKTTQVYLGDTTLKLQVAKDDQERKDLLNKEDIISENSGLLVAYQDEDAHTVPVKDLTKESDILWLDENQRVIYQAKKIPVVKDSTKEIGPEEGTRYILFLQAGIIERKNISQDDKIEFDLNSFW